MVFLVGFHGTLEPLYALSAGYLMQLGGYHFLPNRRAMKRLGGSQNFFMRNRVVTKKARDFWDGYKF